MTGSTEKLVLDRGARQRGARAAASSLLHAHYPAMVAEPLPAELKDLVAQLVVLEAGKQKSGERAIGMLQVTPRLPVG
jgi:hypothetical protein